MTKLDDAQAQALKSFAEAFLANEALQTTIREKHEREIQRELSASRMSLAGFAQQAREVGVPVAQMVKAIGRKGDRAIRLLLQEDAQPAAPIKVQRPALFTLEEGQLRVTLAPAAYSELDVDPRDPSLWTGLFDPFVRKDGKVLIDPTEATDNVRRLAAGLPLHAVGAWLDDESNQQRVAQWYLEQQIAA